MSLKESHTLKQLQSRRQKLQVEIENLNAEGKILFHKQQELRNNVKKINMEIAKLKTRDIVITEHALLRYFERVLNYDLDKIKNEMLSKDTKAKIMVIGNGQYPINNEYKIVVKSNSIISVITNKR